MAVPIYYTVLGLDPGASNEDVHRAYHRLAMQYQRESAQGHTLAARRLQVISEAYAVLGDPVRRAAYDAQLSRVLRRAAHPPPGDAPVQSASEVPPATEPEQIVPSPSGRAGRRAPWKWFRDRPVRSASIVVVLVLFAGGALEGIRHPRASRPVLTVAQSSAVPTGTLVVLALNQPTPSATMPVPTAQASRGVPRHRPQAPASAPRTPVAIPGTGRAATYPPIEQVAGVYASAGAGRRTAAGDGRPIDHPIAAQPETAADGTGTDTARTPAPNPPPPPCIAPRSR